MKKLFLLCLILIGLMISCDDHLPGQVVSVREMRRQAWKLEKQGRQDTCLSLLLKARVTALKEENRVLADSIKEDINLIAKSELPKGSQLEKEAMKADSFYLLANKNNDFIDSSIIYNRRLISSDNLFAQRKGHLGLLKIDLYLGDEIAANDELALYEMANKLVEKSNKEKIAKGVFDHYNSRRNKAHNEELLGMFDTFFVVLALLFGLLIAVGVISYMVINNKEQREQLLWMRIERMKQLQQEYAHKDKRVLEEEQSDIESSEIYQKIKLKLNSPMESGCLSSMEWEKIGDILREVYPTFDTNLAMLCKLSEHEYHVCQLLKMNIAPSAIGELTAHSKEAITSTRRRLYEKAFGQKGSPKDWDDVIKSIS